MLLVAAVCVGVLFEVVKGDGTDSIRYVIGNLAAPWLVVPFLGGRRSWSSVGGAVFGAILAVVSLVSFYAVLEVLSHSLSVHVLSNYALFLGAGALAGAVTGLFGVLSRRYATWWFTLGLPLLFILEPFAAFAVGFSGGRTGTNVLVWAIEMLVGVAMLVGCVRAHVRFTTRITPER
ncbi:hypothetical protein ACLBWP_11015 [Microbacterium sp. M1A1_1b]